jgi:hypothetical protein
MKKFTKKVLVFACILIFTSCGFKVIDQSLKNNYTIKNIVSEGDKRVNFKIKNELLINAKEDSQTVILINLNTTKTKEIKEKNIKNQVTKYQISIDTVVKISVLGGNDYKLNFNGTGDFLVGDNYSTTLNSEKILIESLTDNISKNIINKISLKLNDI